MDMSNYEASSDRSADSKRKKRTKIDAHNRSFVADQTANCPSPTKWRTDSERQIYSVKFLEALRRTPASNPAISNSSTARGRTVRETADRILAWSARGRTRWSRALLSNRLSLKLINKRRHKKVRAPAEIKPKKPDAKRRLPLPPLQRRAQILGKLVPGCAHNLSLPNLLEETTDYIAALEMQVQALSTLAGILTAAGTPTDFPNQP